MMRRIPNIPALKIPNLRKVRQKLSHVNLAMGSNVIESRKLLKFESCLSTYSPVATLTMLLRIAGCSKGNIMYSRSFSRSDSVYILWRAKKFPGFWYLQISFFFGVNMCGSLPSVTKGSILHHTPSTSYMGGNSIAEELESPRF